ncbi:MAG: NTP transferase domain-containing protein [Candidatus Bathyarchaeia archaeon]
MALTAFIMAGGRAARMRMQTEKPLLKIEPKTMLECVIDALQNSSEVDRIIVAVSNRTPMTAQKAVELGVEVMMTPGDGFVEDMQYAIKKSNAGEALVVCADLPFLTSKLVDTVVEEFRRNHNPSLAVVVPLEVADKLGIKPTNVIDIGRKLIPVGLNVIDGQRIEEPELDQSLFIVDSDALAFNVNTPQELHLAREKAISGRLSSHEQKTSLN